MLLSWAIAALGGFTLPFGLKAFLPAGLSFPYTAIAASLVIDLAGLAVLLALLARGTPGDLWTHLGAWLGASAIAAASLAGLACARTHGESAHIFVVLWLVFTAQAATVAAVCGVLRVLSGAPSVSLQLTALLLGIVVTALFWSREPITQFARAGQRQDNSAADRLASGVLKLSPPLALASAWNQECNVARSPEGGSRFDLIRAPLTYEVWIGSYQAMPYPDILPSRQAADPGDYGARPFKPGIVLALLLWGVPLLVFADVLLNRRDVRGTNAGGTRPIPL